MVKTMSENVEYEVINADGILVALGSDGSVLFGNETGTVVYRNSANGWGAAIFDEEDVKLIPAVHSTD